MRCAMPLLPMLTVLAVNVSWLVSGAVVVESVFSLPGLGSLLIRSVGYRDYPLIQGLALVFAVDRRRGEPPRRPVLWAGRPARAEDRR